MLHKRTKRSRDYPPLTCFCPFCHSRQGRNVLPPTTSSTKNQHPDTHTHTHTHLHMLVFPFKGIQGEQTLKHIKGEINKVLPEERETSN